MATKTFNSDRSSLLAVTGSTELGGGQDDHLPIGEGYGGYTFRSVVRFALDWAGVRRITSAVITFRTSTQVHAAFSSAPDFYVSRATSSWSPNSGQSSGDSGGGPGWSTSPVVYPGPSSTSTGRVSKRAPTSESTSFSVDITSIVRAWAPASVEGGGAAANYGVLLHPVVTGDTTEVSSHESVYHPYITLTYDTDAPPPAPTITAPTGTTTDTTPTFEATCVDPDGDPLSNADIEVRQGVTVVLTQAGFVTGVSATAITYTPVSALPSGDLLVRMRAKAGGVYGAWSADKPFTIDRPPTVTGWTAPAATVSGTRRPVHTFSTNDPDGDATEVYDLEVYPASGGAPSGTAAYVRTNQVTGIGAGTVSHTPGADLPPGALVARSRVRARGVWSAWSAYRAYTVVTANPSLSWVSPPTVDGFLLPDVYADLADPAVALLALRYRWEFVTMPPAGFTLTRGHLKIVRVDGPMPASVFSDNDVGVPAAGGNVGFNVTPNGGLGIPAAAWTVPYGTFEFTAEVWASNGGYTKDVRVGRFAAGEWYGAVALGDQVTALAAAETPKVDAVAMLYRAQTSPTAGTAPWRANAALGTVVAELPAVNAYLGVRARIGRKAEDVDLITNGSFEDATLAGWSSVNANKTSIVDGAAIDGSRVLRILGDGVANYPSVNQRFAVLPGATYRMSGWMSRAGATTANLLIRADSYKAGALVTAGILTLTRSVAAWGYHEGHFTVPADGSVDEVQVLLFINLPAAPATQDGRWDYVRVLGLGIGDAGMDRLALTWNSLG